ncbi:hypothetical protein ACFY3M_26600 [Streptomyces mirabilis]|uniref:hypothetical protein n=1 Tax=Streptomyces mirabilis TaxID=68239 RepID=UPI0036A05CEE
MERPTLPGTEQVAVRWGYFDELASWTWDVEPGRDGEEIGRTTLGTVGAPAALRLIPDVTDLTTSRDDLAHVLVEVTDSHGRLVPDATLRVMFQVDGAGELAAVGNGYPHHVDSFRQPRRHTWHGQALAILRPAKRPGRVTLTASAPGLRPAALTLTVGQQPACSDRGQP